MTSGSLVLWKKSILDSESYPIVRAASHTHTIPPHHHNSTTLSSLGHCNRPSRSKKNGRRKMIFTLWKRTVDKTKPKGAFPRTDQFIRMCTDTLDPVKIIFHCYIINHYLFFLFSRLMEFQLSAHFVLF